MSGSGGGGDWFTLAWSDAGVSLIDQRLLPGEERVLVCAEVSDVARAIRELAVRGAPAIGCAAALGMALAARRATERGADGEALARELAAAQKLLAETRPTAVNLAWALARMEACREQAQRAAGRSGAEIAKALTREALKILEEDAACCRAIGAAGAPLLADGARVLTHCNAGALATAAYGTALGVVRSAARSGRRTSVLACETRPYLQGARLTAWELERDGIPVTVITDNMAAWMMQQGEVDVVLIGADRVAANGDVANKIGSYGLALLAQAHGIPFYVAAPSSSIDLDTESGAQIPIEERAPEEVALLAGRRLTPPGVPVRHPAFDITPARLVAALITEHGVVHAPGPGKLAAHLSRP